MLTPAPDASSEETCTHEEYKDLSDNVRHYNTHFLALLTLLAAGTAVLFQVVYGKEKMATDVDKLSVAIIGLIITIVFWIQGEIYLYRQKNFEVRLVELEEGLGYKQYNKLKELVPDNCLYKFLSRVRPGRYSWRVFFVAILCGWVYVMFREHQYLFSVFPQFWNSIKPNG